MTLNFNVILKHNFDGAISNARVSWSTDFGWEGRTIQASQLIGRTWEEWAGMGKGNIVLTYEWWDKSRIYGPGRDYYTTNMEPWGYDDRTFLGMNTAGIISTGNPASATGIPARRGNDTALNANLGTHFCDNCFSIPAGTGTNFQNFGTQTPQVSWATILANKGVKTEIIPETYSWMNPKQANNAFVGTFEQEIVPDAFGAGPMTVWISGFYQNRRGSNAYIPGYSPCANCVTPGATGLTVPTNNPYFPTGVPAGTVVRAHFTVTPNFIPFSDNFIIDRQLQFGFRFDELPYDWQANIFGSLSETHANDHNNGINANMLNAALGNTVASQAASGLIGGHAAFTKPATLPYLNPFCDRSVFQCDSPALINYITSQRLDDSVYHEREYGANFNGPVFDLPGGTVSAAVGFGLLRQSFHVVNDTTETTFNTEIVSHGYQFNKYRNWSATGQLNIPVFGPDFNFPGAEALVFDLGYRVDKYDDFGWVKTPKIGVNWAVGFGLTGRAAYGTSFTAPGFGNITDYQGVRSTNEIFNSGESRNVALPLNCPAVPGIGVVAGTVTPGSLQAALNPNRFGCPAVPGLLPAGPADPGTQANFNSISAPVGLQLNVSTDFLQGKSLKPEHSKQWSLGWNWTPRPDDPVVGVLAGLSLDAEYWHIKLEDRINTLNVGGQNQTQSANDDLAYDATQPVDLATVDMFKTRYIVAPRPDLPLTATQNAAFKDFVDQVVARGKCACNPAAIANIKFIDLAGIANAGWTERAGVDMRARYDTEIGNFGTFGLSAAVSLETRNRSRNPGGPIIDTVFSHTDRTTGVYTGTNSGSHIQSTRFVFTWSDPQGHWVVAPDVQYIPHKNTGTTLPSCFWHPDFGPSHPASTPYGGLCYPGAPYFPQPLITYAPGTAAAISNQEQRWAGLYHPAEAYVNLAVSYNTLDMPTSPYLQNLRVALNVTNVANRVPTLGYDPRTNSGSARVRGGNGGDDMQRQVSISVTKSW
jgi:outer membrane receptor protein involved in Fe transport